MRHRVARLFEVGRASSAPCRLATNSGPGRRRKRRRNALRCQPKCANKKPPTTFVLVGGLISCGGRSRIRTWVGIHRRIYSPLPLAAFGQSAVDPRPRGATSEKITSSRGCFATGFGAGVILGCRGWWAGRGRGEPVSGRAGPFRSFVGAAVRGGGGAGGHRRRVSSHNEQPPTGRAVRTDLYGRPCRHAFGTGPGNWNWKVSILAELDVLGSLGALVALGLDGGKTWRRMGDGGRRGWGRRRGGGGGGGERERERGGGGCGSGGGLWGLLGGAGGGGGVGGRGGGGAGCAGGGRGGDGGGGAASGWAAPQDATGVPAASSSVTTRVFLAGADPRGLAAYATAVSTPGTLVIGTFSARLRLPLAMRLRRVSSRPWPLG